MKFEDGLKKVDDIIDKLESGEIELEDSIEKYQEAIETLVKCKDILDTAEGKVQKIMLDKDNNIIVEEFYSFLISWEADTEIRRNLNVN